MINENILEKSKLISELKEIHIELVEVYKRIFDYKYKIDENFKAFIDKDYKENGIISKEQLAWNDNFCHRASYTLLNKILFIRICEDKGFMLNPEDYVAGDLQDPHIGEKLSKIGLQKWANLVTNYTLGELVKFAFLDMKKSYSNIVLYKEDKYEILNPTNEELSLKYLGGDEETKQIVLEFENVLNSIVEKLDTNNFDLKNTDGNILGDVYEKFMDRETRKAIGQFYTPEFVIEYILKNTVAEADVVENPFVSVADISCGSGHFLIMAYDILREKFINSLEVLRDKYADELYAIKKNGREEELTGKDYWKEENIHYHILKHCIYGADIDSFAVQLTTINLLLKDLDNFTDELNIFECDSLIKWEEDYYWQDLKKQLEEEFETVEYNQINLLGEEEKVVVTRKKDKFSMEYFDISGINIKETVDYEKAEEIINLCEFFSKKFNFVIGNPPWGAKLNKSKKTYYNDKYNFVSGKVETFVLFMQRSIELVKKGDNLGYIVPDTLLFKDYGVFRKYLIDNYYIREIFHTGAAFVDANIDTAIIIIEKHKKNENELTSINQQRINNKIDFYMIDQCEFLKLDDYVLNIALNEQNLYLKNKLDKRSVKMYNVMKFHEGVHSGNIREKLFVRSKLGNDYYKLILGGGEVTKYYSEWEGNYVHYTKSIIDNQKGEYALLRNQDHFESEKIIVRRTGDNIIAYPDFDRYYTSNNLFCGILEKQFPQNFYYYLSALLNSRLIQYYYRIINPRIGNIFSEIKIKHLHQLPVIIDDKDELISGIAKNFKTIIKYNFEIKNLEFIIEDRDYNEIIESYRSQCQIENNLLNKIRQLEEETEYLVFKLYNLNDTEIKYVKEYTNDLEDSNSKLNNNCINDKLYNKINNLFKRECHNILLHTKIFTTVNNLRTELEKKISNFDALIHILRDEKNILETISIIKNLIDSDAYTWNAYRKAKKNNEVNRTFIKYYDNKFYSLAEWSDEIHKNYFLDAIEEYTVNNPNEKKAKDILKLFKDLNIEDKQDYIEVIKEKIRKTFK